MYFRMSYPVPSLKHLAARFLNHREATRPCCCTPNICCRSCLGCWRVSLTVDWFMHFRKWWRELFPHKSRKNNCISRTIQRIQTGLAHSNIIINVGLICSLGCPHRKTNCLIIEIVTHSTFYRHPSAPKAATTTNTGYAAIGSCSFPMVQKSCCKMLQRRNRKRHPKIHDS